MPTIIFKATEACNSNCIYCDVVHRKQPRTIPLDILEVAYQRINEYLLEHTEDEMHIIWHGGEPCMAGLKLYTEALRFQETYCAETKDRIKYAVQSNLTMINQDFIDVFFYCCRCIWCVFQAAKLCIYAGFWFNQWNDTYYCL